MISGFDEAGRGCVIGPMVICMASIESMDEFKLKALGVRDSKKISPGRREALFPEIKRLCKLSISLIPASELNRLMDSYNLNEIEAQKVAYLLNHSKVPSTIVYIDSPDNPPINFSKRIKKYLKAPLKLQCENKAEDAHPIVGAASIIAKVTRDREIERIKAELGEDFGSGYTSDPVTISFLSRNLKNPKLAPYIRTKWKTVSNAPQTKLSDYPDAK